MLAILLMTFGSLQLQADTVIERDRISIDRVSVTIKDVLKEITKQSGHRFFYSGQKVDVKKRVTVHLQNVSLREALRDVLRDAPVAFKIIGKQIILYDVHPSEGMEVSSAEGPVRTYTVAEHTVSGSRR